MLKIFVCDNVGQIHFQFMNLCIRGITIKTFRENMFVCIEVKNFNINGSILHNMEIFLNGAVNKINASIFSSFSGTTAPLFTIESDISVNLLIGSSKILEVSMMYVHVNTN
jgi:hypothetical protein